MKKKILMPLTAFAALSTIVVPLASMTSCAKKQEETKEEFTIAFETFGATPVKSIKVKSGEVASAPTDIPTKEYATFVGWYNDTNFETIHDWSEPVVQSFTVYAKFEFVGLDSISVNKQPIIDTYIINDKLTLGGLQILAKLKDGKEVIVPDTMYTVTPEEGTVLDTEGDIDVEVAIDDVKTTFQVHVLNPVTSVSFKPTRGLDNFEFGDVIKRSDFEVIGTTASGEEVEITDWEWYNEAGEKIEGDSYRLIVPGSENIKISYGIFHETFKCKVGDVTHVELDMPTSIGLTFGQVDGKDVISYKNIKIITGEGKVPVQMNKFQFDVTDKNIINVTYGKIEPLKVGSTDVSVKWLGQTEELFKINVTVSAPQTDRYEFVEPLVGDPYIKVSDLKNFTINNICTIPDAIKYDISTYPLQLSKANAVEADNLDQITHINFGQNVSRIEDGLFANLPGGKTSMLQSAKYDGTKDELYYNVSATSGWGGHQLVGVDCSDGMYLFSDCLNAKLQAVEEEGYIATAVADKFRSTTRSWTKTIRINYSELGFDLMASYHNTIGILYTRSPITLVSYEEVYLDGTKLTQDTDYVLNTENNTITIDEALHPLTAKSNLVVKISGMSEEEQDIWMGCVPNFPAEIKVGPYYKDSFKVGDKFELGPMFELKAFYLDGTSYVVDKEFIETNPQVGYTFTKDDISDAKQIVVKDTITGLTTSYTVKVTA